MVVGSFPITLYYLTSGFYLIGRFLHVLPIYPSIYPLILKSGKEPIQYIHIDKNRRKKKNKQMNNTTHTA